MLQVAAVAVIKGRLASMPRRAEAPRIPPALSLALVALALPGALSEAASLPQDQADIAVHSYSGGDVDVTGPTVTARKTFLGNLALGAHYHADAISSASVDVVTTASPYEDRRDEVGASVDYLFGDTVLSARYILSEEDDYSANSFAVDSTQDVFGGMTTVKIGFSRGWDEVRRIDTDFSEDVNHWKFRVGASQIVTSKWIVDASYEAIADEGFLNNPYRSARVLGAVVPERYPRTRTSNALALRSLHALPIQASVRADYRYFWDTWSVQAHTVELGYNQYLGPRWIVELRYRYYTQTGASFYADNFDREYNYVARDKELSDFTGQAWGASVSYDLLSTHRQRWIQRGTVSASYDLLRFDYDNFTDLRTGARYGFDAQLLQLLFSLRY